MIHGGICTGGLCGCKYVGETIKIFSYMKHVIFDCDGTLIDTSGSKYKLFPGIKELLAELSPHCLLYVWTARGRSSTLRILEELGVYSYFDRFCCIDDSFPKPHVGGLIDLVGKAPKHSICVIGDSFNDMLGAKNFGVMGIGAVWNRDVDMHYLKDAGADFIVSHPSECSILIQQNLKAE
ncbi:HAD family hydrolase [Peredibacter starrii]|uniref:phosphoglycolate phosphatase n=1 Tax=Peredibacter starrii TaxID=28202 RepID=A0AAX4HKK8_9BACT|nr:HAD family hydrolase [Peredibacter starrii]WPU63771.1 HAD family hydrolase [Peredibacter starrii]